MSNSPGNNDIRTVDSAAQEDGSSVASSSAKNSNNDNSSSNTPSCSTGQQTTTSTAAMMAQSGGEGGLQILPSLTGMLSEWWDWAQRHLEYLFMALQAASSAILKVFFFIVVMGAMLTAVVAIGAASGFTFAASVRWFVLRGTPEDASIPLEFDSNFRVSEGLGREWLERLSDSVKQTIDAAVDEMPTSTPLGRRALRIKEMESDHDDDHNHHGPTDTASLIQALLRGDSDREGSGDDLLLDALSGGGGGVSRGVGGVGSVGSYQRHKAEGGMGRLGGDLSVPDLLESSRSSPTPRRRSRDGSAAPVLGLSTKGGSRSRQKQEEQGLLDQIWETALAPGSGRNFPFVEDTLPHDDELLKDGDINWGSWGGRWTDEIDGELESDGGGGLPPLSSSFAGGNGNIDNSPPLPPNTCPLHPGGSCDSCHKTVERQAEHSRNLAVQLLKQKEKQTKLKLTVAARLVESSIKEGKSQQAAAAWTHISGLVADLIRLRSRAESAVESSMVAKTTLQLTDLTTRGSSFSFLRKVRPGDNAPLSLHQPRYTLRAGTSYDIFVTVSTRIHYRPGKDDISPSSLQRADCQISGRGSGRSTSAGTTTAMSWLWGWVGGDRLWKVDDEANAHDRCGASAVSFRDTQLVLHSGLVTGDRGVLAESSEMAPIRTLPLFLEGSLASLGVATSSLYSTNEDTTSAAGYLYTYTFGVCWAIWDWCLWCALLPLRVCMFVGGTVVGAVWECILWFSFGWLRMGIWCADCIARFVMGVPQSAPSLLHHYLHLVPPHTSSAFAPSTLSSSPTTTAATQQTVPLVGYANNVVFSIASGFVPSADLISKLASLELLLMREVDSSTSTATTGGGEGTFPSRVTVSDAHVTFHVSLQGLQYYFTEYPVSSFVILAAIWGGGVGGGCLALVGVAVAMFFSSSSSGGDIYEDQSPQQRWSNTKAAPTSWTPPSPRFANNERSNEDGRMSMRREESTAALATTADTVFVAPRPSRRPPVHPPPSPPSTTHTSDSMEEVSDTDGSGYTQTSSSIAASSTTAISTVLSSGNDLSSLPGANRVWTPRPVRSRGGSRKETNSPTDASWVDISDHRQRSEEAWARRSEEPAATPGRSATTGQFGAVDPVNQTRLPTATPMPSSPSHHARE